MSSLLISEIAFGQRERDSRFGAEAEPKLRALGVIWRALPDRPDLAWKFVERREPGFGRPIQVGPPSPEGPVVIQLSLTEGKPLPRWVDAPDRGTAAATHRRRPDG